MDGKLDTVRRGLEIADAFCGEHTADECPDTVAIPIKSALAALSAIGPDAIRRVLRSASKIVKETALEMGLDDEEVFSISGIIDPDIPGNYEAILSADPAQDDRLKPPNYDDENPCASCRANDPSDCFECEPTDAEHVDSGWKPKPAQDARAIIANAEKDKP